MALGLGVAAVSLAAFTYSEMRLRADGADGGAFEDEFRKIGPVWGVFFFLGASIRRGVLRWADVRRFWPALAALAVLGWALYAVHVMWQEAWLGSTPRLQIALGALPLQLFGGVLALVGLERLERTGVGRGLARLSGDTFGIYLCHNAVLVLLFGALATRGLTTAAAWETPALWLAVGLVSWLLVRAAAWAGQPTLARLIFGLRLRA